MTSAPVVFHAAGKTIVFPTDAALLPGLTPAAVDRVLSIIEKHAVDPATVDIVKANLAGARFAVEVSSFSVAETLRRMDRGDDIKDYERAVHEDSEFEAVAEAFAAVVARNPKVFKGKPNAPADAPQGN